MSMQSSTILEKMVTSCSLERPDMFGPPSVEAGGGICTHRVIKGCLRRGGRRCTGEKEIIEVAAGLADAGHVGVDGW